MKFAVTGTDARFEAVKRRLQQDGHELAAVTEAECIIPPPWERGAFYTRNAEYVQRNALLTARGAAETLIREGTAEGRVLLLGFGRVGQCCAAEFLRHGWTVTAAARRGEQRALAEALGCESCEPGRWEAILGECTAVVNTVPAPIFREEDIARLPGCAVLLELASAPGGIDAAAARERGLHYLRTPGLPALTDPAAAADILTQAVYAELRKEKKRAGLAVTGSHCCFAAVFPEFRRLAREYEAVPILSPAAAQTDTRFGRAADFRAELERLCGCSAVTDIAGAEPFGSITPLDVLLIAPCTGNTLAKLARGITDSTVTMAAKAHLRNGRPLVLAISTNDGLSGSAESIARLLQRKNVYFVPFRQDDPGKKPFSLQADFSLIAPAVEAALRGKQLQPILAEGE